MPLLKAHPIHAFLIPVSPVWSLICSRASKHGVAQAPSSTARVTLPSGCGMVREHECGARIPRMGVKGADFEFALREANREGPEIGSSGPLSVLRGRRAFYDFAVSGPSSFHRCGCGSRSATFHPDRSTNTIHWRECRSAIRHLSSTSKPPANRKTADRMGNTAALVCSRKGECSCRKAER